MTTHQPPPPPWKIRRLSRSLTPLCLPLPIAFSYLTPWGWTWSWRRQWASLVLPPDLTVKLPGTSTEQGKGSLTLEWCLPASPNSLESTGTTQPSLPLTISGAPLRSSVSCFIPVVLRRTPYPSPPLQSNCLTLVATWYSTHDFLRLVTCLLLAGFPTRLYWHSLHSGLSLATEGQWPTRPSAHFPFPVTFQLQLHLPPPTPLSCPWSFWCYLCVAQCLLELEHGLQGLLEWHQEQG